MHARGYDRLCSPVAVLSLAVGLATFAHAGPRPPGPSAPQAKHPSTPQVLSISEDELRRELQGKTFYLRGGYLDNTLRFDQYGRLVGSAPQVSYTLSLVEINKVNLSKHKVQLEGIRYALHFLGGGSTEDPVAASEKVRITPKKKVLRITIDRAEIVKAKKVKEAKPEKGRDAKLAAAQSGQPGGSNRLPNQAPALSGDGGESAAAAGFENAGAATQAHANQMLKEAIERVLSQGLDQRMIASLPDYWRLYYQASGSKSSYRPSEALVLRQNAVDQKARLLSRFEPPSNDYAQAAGVAGVALYHVVVGPDGKPAEIAVGRPIGFGLDENAVASIRKASFQPAMKDGKPVAVMLDLLVQFRIYSKRTADAAKLEATSAAVGEPDGAPLPGPYSAGQPQAKQPQ